MVEGLNTELQQFSDLRDSTSIKSAAVTVDSNSQTDSSVKNKQKKKTQLPFPFFNRCHVYTSSVLEDHLHVLLHCTGHSASFLLETIPQEERS